MPKTNFCRDLKKEEREKKMIAVRAMLVGKKSENGMSMEELAKKTGINSRTLYHRQQHPETMRLGELWAIMDVLKPESFYLEKII